MSTELKWDKIAVGAQQMREMEAYAAAKLGVPTLVLMENAAISLCWECAKTAKELGVNDITLVCGTGNNGGDGFTCARLLVTQGYNAKVILVGLPEHIRGDARTNYDIIVRMGISIYIFPDCLVEGSIIVDCLFGTGLQREVVGKQRAAIEAINKSGSYIIAADLPSGIASVNGEVLGVAVKADKTVTFGCMKVGMLLYPGAEYVGETVVGNIGVPLTPPLSAPRILDDEYAGVILGNREQMGHKFSFGKVHVVAGSKNMTGAAALSAMGALRAGCGLVEVDGVKPVTEVTKCILPEALTYTLSETNPTVCADDVEIVLGRFKQGVMLLGPGLSVSKDTELFVHKLLCSTTIPKVLDADCLNILADNIEGLSMSGDTIITPHVGEMSRLTKLSAAEINANPVEVAARFAQKHSVITVLKSARTIIASPDGRININTSGTSALATAGSGDVLGGVIASLWAQGIGPFNAAVLGCYLHGLAGRLAGEELSEYGVTATDIAAYIPKAFLKIKTNR